MLSRRLSRHVLDRPPWLTRWRGGEVCCRRLPCSRC